MVSPMCPTMPFFKKNKKLTKFQTKSSLMRIEMSCDLMISRHVGS